MARKIRQIGLKLVVALLRLFSPPARAGWRASSRPTNLRGR
jgi:hypothetical protein